MKKRIRWLSLLLVGLLLLAVVLVRPMKFTLAMDPERLDSQGPVRIVCGYLPQELDGKPTHAQMRLQNGSGEITADGRTIATIRFQERRMESSFGVGWGQIFSLGNNTTIFVTVSPKYRLCIQSDILGTDELSEILTTLELE